MQQSVVSIVLPIYGVEKYLDRCVDSIVNQTYRNLEIIMVDDGSQDNCPAMCEQWATKDSRIKVIHKENEGLGMARNTGIENATGDYICFFDSDDYIALDAIEKVVSLAEKECSDIVLFGIANVNSAGEVVKRIVPQVEQVTCYGRAVQEEFLPDLIATIRGSSRKNLYMSACLCLYSLEMIRKSGWQFASEREIISEDVFSLLCLYKYVGRVSVLSDCLYYYCENGASLSHTYRSDRFEKICYFYETSIKKIRELGYCKEVECRMQSLFVSFSIAAMKMIVNSELFSENEKREQIRHIFCKYISKIQWQKVHIQASFSRRVFEFCMKNRLTWGCYFLLKISNR